MCRLFVEAESESGGRTVWQVIHSWADSDFEADLAARNGACAVVHAHRRCEVVLEYWRIAE